VTYLGCIDCGETIEYPELPGEARCPSCGTEQYVTADGKRGRYPGPRSFRGI
jgi:predicted RNA-binding Zn-ribbon protein involved in translation (DUF1610 family)